MSAIGISGTVGEGKTIDEETIDTLAYDHFKRTSISHATRLRGDVPPQNRARVSLKVCLDQREPHYSVERLCYFSLSKPLVTDYSVSRSA